MFSWAVWFLIRHCLKSTPCKTKIGAYLSHRYIRKMDRGFLLLFFVFVLRQSRLILNQPLKVIL